MAKYHKEMHKEMGCDRCYYADREMLYKGACCRYGGKLSVDSKTGRCLKLKITHVDMSNIFKDA